MHRKGTGHVRVAALTCYKLEAQQRERDGPALQQADAVGVSEQDGEWKVRMLDHDEIDGKASVLEGICQGGVGSVVLDVHSRVSPKYA